MRVLMLAAIRAYQRFLSPYKGFCCAYRHHTGRASCSALGYRAVRRHGVFGGLVLLRRRTYLCGVAHRRCTPAARRPPVGQRGDCDVPCDCHFSVDHGGHGWCQAVSCCDGCDWSSRRKKDPPPGEQRVYIPARATGMYGAGASR